MIRLVKATGANQSRAMNNIISARNEVKNPTRSWQENCKRIVFEIWIGSACIYVDMLGVVIFRSNRVLQSSGSLRLSLGETTMHSLDEPCTRTFLYRGNVYPSLCPHPSSPSHKMTHSYFSLVLSNSYEYGRPFNWVHATRNQSSTAQWFHIVYTLRRLRTFKDWDDQLRPVWDVQVAKITYNRRGSIKRPWCRHDLMLTRWIIIPNDRPLYKVFHSFKVAMELSVDARSKGWESALQVNVLSNAIGNHVRDYVDGILKVGVSFDHHTYDQVLIIAVSLFFL